LQSFVGFIDLVFKIEGHFFLLLKLFSQAVILLLEMFELLLEGYQL